MKCLLCAKWSWRVVCPACLSWLEITLQKREIEGFIVYSFYDFDEVRDILHYKYEVVGSKVIAILAKKAARFFATQAPSLGALGVAGIPLDDEPSRGYSHTAIIARAFQKAGIAPLYGALRARNRTSYAGKSLEFRQKNPRKFHFKMTKKIESAILIDDLITTGSTMLEARETLEKHGVSVLFGICLSDARGIVKED